MRPLALALLAVALAACGGDGNGGPVTVELLEANDSGQTGTATLRDAGQSGTSVVIEASPPAAYPGDVQPSSLSEAPCEDVIAAGSEPAQAALVAQVLSEVRDGRSETTAAKPFDELTGGGYSIVVYEQNPPYVPVLCGDIPEP
jgi:hypothetical protein